MARSGNAASSLARSSLSGQSSVSTCPGTSSSASRSASVVTSVSSDLVESSKFDDCLYADVTHRAIHSPALTAAQHEVNSVRAIWRGWRRDRSIDAVMASPAVHDLVCALAEPTLPPALKGKVIERILEVAYNAITTSNDVESNEAAAQSLQAIKK